LELIEEPTAISMLSTHLIMYFGRKERADDAFLHGVIGANELLPLTAEDYDWAAANERGRDFEDALQLATALRAGCTSFVTLDRALAKAYAGLPIDIVSV
jgi:predicted nucleic acid-binding protein